MSSEKHFEHTVALSRDALKSLLLVNGGAATALVALMDKGGKNYTDAIILFGLGTILSVVSACFGYLSQLNYANSRFQHERNLDNTASYKKHQSWQNATIATVIVTLLFMLAGILQAAWIAAT